MPIETVEDIVEELANKIGVYGSHDVACIDGIKCHCCWISALMGRISRAVEVEIKLGLRVTEAKEKSDG